MDTLIYRKVTRAPLVMGGAPVASPPRDLLELAALLAVMPLESTLPKPENNFIIGAQGVFRTANCQIVQEAYVTTAH
jgi:hypothetical protein